MKNLKLKKAISIAQEAVKEISDENLKLKTYEIVLNNLLSKKAKIQKEELSKDNIPSPKDNDSYQFMSKKLNIDIDKIEDFVEFDNKEIQIFNPIKRETTTEQQIIFTLIYLTIKYMCFNEKEIESGYLREILSERQISLSNLSTHLKKIPTLLTHKSKKKGSTKTSYRITKEGFVKGAKLLKEFIEKKTINDVELDFIKSFSKKKTKSSGITNTILTLIEEGFFNSPIPISQLKIKLEEKGFFFDRNVIDEKIRRRFFGKELTRIKKDKIWHYVFKK